MAKSLLWDGLSQRDVEAVSQLQNADEVRSFLKAHLQIPGAHWLCPDTEEDAEAKNLILLDFFFHTLRFCREQGFSAEKTSVLFSIMYHTHTTSMAKRLSNTDSYALFQEYIIQHSVHRPPYSAAIFDVIDIQAINAYVTGTYFANYKLYLFAFSSQETLTVASVFYKDTVETAPDPPPLAQAMPEEDWLRRVAAQREADAQTAAEQAEQQQREVECAAALKAAGPAGPPDGLGGQLEYIRRTVAQMTGEKLDELEAKLTALESRLSDGEGQKAVQRGAKKGK